MEVVYTLCTLRVQAPIGTRMYQYSLVHAHHYSNKSFAPDGPLWDAPVYGYPKLFWISFIHFYIRIFIFLKLRISQNNY